MRVGVALLLTAALVTWVMHLSMERGRLAVYPRVDDVIYMARGAELWRAGQEGWERGGVASAVKGLVRDWKREPPHSPWASACAAMGYGVFGVKDWAAYVFTGVPVLAFVLAVGRIGRRAGGRCGWRALLLMVCGASAPFLAASVQNLKPDYCAGILGAIGMMLLLRGPLFWGSWKRLCWAGAMFGLALLAKPAMMMPTGLLCLGTVGICVVRDVVLGEARERWAWMVWRAGRGFGLVVATAIVVALPHYALSWGHVWAYTMQVLDWESYAATGTGWDRALYYLTGPGGKLMLDGARGLAAMGGLIVGYGVFCAVWRVRRRSMYFAAMVCAVVMAWAGPTLATAKISQFAAAFDALLWLVGLYAAAGMVGGLHQKRGAVWGMAAWVIVLLTAAIWMPTFAMHWSNASDPQRESWMQRTGLVRDVYAAALAAARDRGAEKREALVVLAGSPSELGRPLMEYWAVRDGIRVRVHEIRRIPTVGEGSAETPESIALRNLGEGDVVLVGEPGTSMTRPKPVTAGADEFYLGIARGHLGLELAGRVVDPVTGKVREVYRKKLSALDTARP